MPLDKKVLGWMRHRSKKTNIEPFKDFLIGNYCTCLSAQSPIDDHVSYTGPSFDSRYGPGLLKQPNEECENTFSENEGVDENNGDETSIISSDLFHGFLTIGTLGSEPITSEPATPTFPMSLESITEENIEVTENELKIMNNELEKFLEAEAEEEGCNESLARSSYVSTITLSGMQMETTDAEDYGKTVACPLQGYLFGSSVELPETGVGVKKEKVSLGEMFRMTKVTDEIPSEKEVKGEMQAKKAHKSSKYLIKKILRMFRTTSGNPTPSTSDETSNSVSTKKTLNKVLKVLHRKVHPENPLAEREFTKSHKDKTMNTLNDGGYNAELTHQVKAKRKFLPGYKSREGVQCHKNSLKLPQHDHICSNSSANREYWIKTDADYLVLEL
ncbi:protein LAZY 1 [Populus alba x Populus x berolinensis]|uniref:Protein LAZY 1 n=1 Tax=Populus alba x Populus x berolinensis TaxID=444605 RepID=A0AAD6RRG4_9ROSI|nr:protein LAZY 1 [Populus alba x Populus x berolinensis]